MARMTRAEVFAPDEIAGRRGHCISKKGAHGPELAAIEPSRC